MKKLLILVVVVFSVLSAGCGLDDLYAEVDALRREVAEVEALRREVAVLREEAGLMKKDIGDLRAQLDSYRDRYKKMYE